MSDQTPVAPAEPTTTPLLRVVKGDPTPEELAALVAVVAARGAVVAPAAAQRRSAWGDPAVATRPAHSHGHDGWRRSAFAR
ncbi:acyl-CoA carboxylase subunit epsilon [Mumia zhuanghuii]|uniref:Acyl-CoA carboxylase subunit epsilon n=1 Tax=Mumia zhuanghuii TaxID=2585211 RepID=A0A5C4MJT5_9ACTN|nr:acyl-CoA carboxylase subunit epsilon [Mumia zhuanghuii]TNC31212.1 acyl-CoA carboxylase subunit epsilon [Mumia zhuanghuii]TNC44927.1 acyl-CoA carboxylase subunit epsilon [Mumia zhuanghuii]